MQEMKDTFTKQPTLQIANETINTSVNGKIIPITDLGTVLQGNVEHFGEFGRLYVRDGVFLSGGGSIAVVPAVDIVLDENLATGKNWTLEMADGWEVVPNAQGYVLQRK